MTIKLTRLILSALLIAVLLLSIGGVHAMPLPVQTRGEILYVKPIARSGDCSSWENACELLAALDRAASGNEIWVMTGTYKTTLINDRDASFVLVNGVALYGGFDGTEIEREQRDWVGNPTTLSGDIGAPGDPSDNSYHVVYGTALDATTILDGLTITAGVADGFDQQHNGGGLYLTQSSPTLNNVTFAGNSAFIGAGMYNYDHSSPTLSNVIFSGNTASGGGGGMYNAVYSSPSLTGVNFTSNSADVSGGGMYNFYSSPLLTNVTFSENSTSSSGGGMYNGSYSDAILTNVTFEGNSAKYGGGMFNSYSDPLLFNGTFSENSAEVYGGGMYNDEQSYPILSNVLFSSNTSSSMGGGMYNYINSAPSLTHVTFTSNSAVNYGGGMCNYASSPSLTFVTFSRNSALSGGGMYNNESSSPTLTHVTFSNNSAESGGGMFNLVYSSPTLNNVTFSGNRAPSGLGGGMVNAGYSSPRLTNVTFSFNDANWGGGLYNGTYSNPDLTNVTFSENMASKGGGIYNYDNCSPTITNTILWGNGEEGLSNDTSTPVITYSVIQGGYTGTGNINADPHLAPLADNGGFTQTHALLTGSSAIDTGSLTVCPVTDQRGYFRPIDGNGDGPKICDIGAYEFGSVITITLYLPLILR